MVGAPRQMCRDASTGAQLHRADGHVAPLAGADHGERDVGADAVGVQQPLQVVHAADRDPVHGDDQVLGAQPGARGRGLADHLDHLDRPVAATSAAVRGGSGRAPPAIPIHARRTRPSRIRALTTRRVVALIGTARPRPMPATAVLMPTRKPRPSTSAPPELPGLSAASVWMTSSMMRVAPPERAGSERPSAETTPAVTEPS